MALQNMPTALQAAIQQNFLQREFLDGLTSRLAYRRVADRENIAINIGETVTKTRRGLKAPATTPITPSGNTNLDNGLSPSAFTIEQYTLPMNMYADTIDLNVVTSQVGIANQFLANGKTNGVQAAQTLDRLARNALFGTSTTAGGYLGGNTRVRVTIGAPQTTVQVDDVRGFGVVLQNGTFAAVSASNTAQVLVGSNTYTLTGVAVDATNVSAAASTGGLSGVLTFSGNVTVADATALNTVTHLNGPALVRPNGKYYGGSAFASTTATSSLTTSDVLTLGTIEDAVAMVRNNTGISDDLDLYLDFVSMRQLFADQDFKLMYQGQYGSPEARQGKVFQLMGVNFIPTTEAFVQASGSGVNVKVRRPIVCAPGALIEGDFAGMQEKAYDFGGTNSMAEIIDGVAMVTRGPLDRLQQIIAQSWYWMGGFVAPSDATATSTIIPTAGSQYFKRACVIEHAG